MGAPKRAGIVSERSLRPAVDPPVALRPPVGSPASPPQIPRVLGAPQFPRRLVPARRDAGGAHAVAWKGSSGRRPTRADHAPRRACAHVAGRLRHAPRFRQRLAFPPGGLAEPVWVDDDRFNLGHHVVALAGDDEPLSRQRFDELADLALSEPLDRSRALWRILVAPRLEDGRLGLVMMAHHAMARRQVRASALRCCCSTSPRSDAPEEIDDAWRPRPAPGAARLAFDALADRGREPRAPPPDWRASPPTPRGAGASPTPSSRRALARRGLLAGALVLRQRADRRPPHARHPRRPVDVAPQRPQPAGRDPQRRVPRRGRRGAAPGRARAPQRARPAEGDGRP